jgi:hypothetical protein
MSNLTIYDQSNQICVLHEDGDILRVPSLLHEMSEDYRNEIKKHM